MNELRKVIIIICILLNNPFSSAQEWRNIKEYKKTTGKNVLQNGCWLKKDRNKNTKTWKEANKYNLLIDNGNLKYKTISQIRDFYLWFDEERKKQGIEINTFGITSLVAGQLAYFDNYFIRTFIICNKEIIWFGNQGSKRVLAYFFPLIKEIYLSKKILKGKEAKKWDIENGKIEQCQIVEALYNQLSPKAIRKLERIAKGKGIYNLGVKNALKFEGDITDCKSRYEHAFYKLLTYYLNEKQ